jgi:hypothetical protein
MRVAEMQKVIIVVQAASGQTRRVSFFPPPELALS